MSDVLADIFAAPKRPWTLTVHITDPDGRVFLNLDRLSANAPGIIADLLDATRYAFTEALGLPASPPTESEGGAA